MPLHELRKQHPMPWRYVTMPMTNQIVMADARNGVVPMFLMLDLVVQHTHEIEAAAAEAAKKAAESSAESTPL